MSDCNKKKRPRFFCPTKWDFLNAIGGLLPHGRAWQSNDWVYGAKSLEEIKTGMQRWWAVFAQVLGDLSKRACDLTNEFYCPTASETLELWYLDYGFPDECIEFENLCAKVSARGGATNEYLEGVAKDNGWNITISDGREPHVMDVAVDRLSPAMQYGPNFEVEFPKLTCLLGRTVPAHVWPDVSTVINLKNDLGVASTLSGLEITECPVQLGVNENGGGVLGVATTLASLQIAERSFETVIQQAITNQIGMAATLASVQIFEVNAEVI